MKRQLSGGSVPQPEGNYGPSAGGRSCSGKVSATAADPTGGRGDGSRASSWSAGTPKRLETEGVAQHFNLNEAVGRAEAAIIMHAIEVHGDDRARPRNTWRISERALRFKFARLRRLGLMGSCWACSMGMAIRFATKYKSTSW